MRPKPWDRYDWYGWEQGHHGWSKVSAMGDEEVKGQTETPRKGTEAELSCSSWSMVHSCPSHSHNAHGPNPTHIALSRSLACRFFLNLSTRLIKLFQSYYALQLEVKGQTSGFKVRAIIPQGIWVAGALLSQCYNETPGKLHTFTLERGKLPSGDQDLGHQVSKFNRSQEAIQIYQVFTKCTESQSFKNGLYQGLVRSVTPECKWKIIQQDPWLPICELNKALL